MKKNLRTKFSTRQYMLSKDFEVYYYDEPNASQVSLHGHDYYEFYFFLEGEVSILVEEKEYSLSYGDMVIIPPHVKHQAIIHNHLVPYRRFVFWITQEYCNYLMQTSSSYGYLMQLSENKKKYVFNTEISNFHSIQYALFQLIEEILSERFGKEAKVSLLVSELILQLNRMVYEQENPITEKEEHDLFEQIMIYLEQHIAKDLSLDRLSELFFVSKYHIAHLFKERIGISIHQYILKKRMYEAKKLILTMDRISQAYQLIGFKDYSSFFRAFKKEFGVSPKEYKEEMRKRRKDD